MQPLLLLWVAFLTNHVVYSQFLYPNANSPNDFNDQDTIILAYKVPYRDPTLSLYCQYENTREFRLFVVA